MKNKHAEILESIKIHLREQLESYRAMEQQSPNIASQRTFKYHDEQNRVLLSLIDRLECMYSEIEYKNKMDKLKV